MKILLLILLPIVSFGQFVKSGSNFIMPQIFINQKVVGFDCDLWLPDTIYLTEGNSIQIYNDNLAYIPDNKKNRLTFDWVCSIGTETTTYYNIKASTTGDYSIKVYATNSIGNIIDSASSVITIEPKIALGNKTILAIGNSLTAGGWVYDRPQIDDSLNVTLTSVGTKGSNPNMHEGISGWTYAKFMGVLSPFYIGGKIDFDAYCTALPSYPDVIRVQLGINDCLFSILNGTITMATLEGTVNKMIDSLLNQTTANIILCLPTTGANTHYGAIAQLGDDVKYEPYILTMRQFHKAIYTTYGNKNYNSRVYMGFEELFIDRNLGYPKVSGLHSDLVHPVSTGHRQFIRGTLNMINHIYQ